MSPEHDDLLAAYFAWERASDACYRRLADRNRSAPFDGTEEPDLRHLQRLYGEWLAKLETLTSVREH